MQPVFCGCPHSDFISAEAPIECRLSYTQPALASQPSYRTRTPVDTKLPLLTTAEPSPQGDQTTLSTITVEETQRLKVTQNPQVSRIWLVSLV